MAKHQVTTSTTPCQQGLLETLPRRREDIILVEFHFSPPPHPHPLPTSPDSMPLGPREDGIADGPLFENDNARSAAAWLKTRTRDLRRLVRKGIPWTVDDIRCEAGFVNTARQPGDGKDDRDSRKRRCSRVYCPSSSSYSATEKGYNLVNINNSKGRSRSGSSNSDTTHVAATKFGDGSTGGLHVEDGLMGRDKNSDNSNNMMTAGAEDEEGGKEEGDDDDTFSYDFGYDSSDESYSDERFNYEDSGDDNDDDWHWSGSDEAADDWETPEDWYRWGGLGEQLRSFHGNHHRIDIAELGRKAWAY